MRRGHFRLESGHHGNLWLDLETLCQRPRALQRFTILLAQRISPHKVEVICGPLIEGALVALLVASELGVDYCYAERLRNSTAG